MSEPVWRVLLAFAWLVALVSPFAMLYSRVTRERRKERDAAERQRYIREHKLPPGTFIG